MEQQAVIESSEATMANIVRAELMRIMNETNEKFAKKFENFIASKPDGEFNVLLDIYDTYNRLMSEFIKEVKSKHKYTGIKNKR